MSLTLTLRYGTDAHDKVRDRIRELFEYGRNGLKEFYARTREDEDQFYAYSEPVKDESQRTKPIDETGRPEYRTIRIPYAYAIAMTHHTYLSSVFLARDPILQYEGRHGETQDQEMAVEALIDYQITAGRAKGPLYNWVMDPLRYGVGILGCYWKEDISYISKLVEVDQMFTMLVPGLFPKKKTLIEEPVVNFKGNELYNVRPIDFVIDPRYSFPEMQKGEFCGEMMLFPMARFEQGCLDGTYIKENADAVQNLLSGNGNFDRERGSEQAGKEPERLSTDTNYLNSVLTKDQRKHVLQVVEFYWRVVPSVWGLGTSNKQQLWYFCVAENEVILSARPVEARHNRFPYSILQYDIDYYKKASRSTMQIMQPMEQVLEWLVNQHFYNVRKHLNNKAIIDPSMLVVKDLYQAAPGGYIRKRPEAYGKDASMAYMQLQNTDITRSHLSDVRMMEEFAQRLMGVNDNIMGLVNPGGRKTAQEVRVSSSFATNRLKTLAEWWSATGFQELSGQMLVNSQQYYDAPMKLRIAGDLVGPNQQNFLEVKPEMIDGFFDFSIVDGTMPIDRFAVANLMRDMFSQIMSTPLVSQYRPLDLFEYIGQLAGARNLKRFRIQVQQPDQIQQGVQAGNIVPLRPAVGNVAQPENMPPTGPANSQMPGMGNM